MMLQLSDISELWNDTRLVFVVTEDAVQATAKARIGRALTERELHAAAKMIEAGLGFGLETVLNAAIDEASQQ